MNILLVSHYGEYSGDLSSSFVHAQARALAARGHRVRALILTPLGKRRAGHRWGPFYGEGQADGVELRYVRYLSLSNRGERGFNAAAARRAADKCLPQLVRGFTPDIIHAHTLGTDSAAALQLKSRLGCPLVITTHGSDTSIPVQQGRTADLKIQCDGADHVVAVSSTLRQKLRTCGTKTPVSVILNGFHVQAVPRTGAEKTPCSLLQVSNLIRQKHVDTTLTAFAQVKKAHPEARLTVIGRGPERENLESLARELGVARDVRFTGQLPNEEVLAEMARTQFFCMPSVREGFGIVYLEAMASGCLTMGTRGEGVADLIENGKNGFLVPPEEPAAIAELIEWGLAHPEEAAAIAARGRQDALSLTWERNAAAYEKLYLTLSESEKNP